MKRILLNNRKLSWIVSKTISVLLFWGLSFTGCLETTREDPHHADRIDQCASFPV